MSDVLWSQQNKALLEEEGASHKRLQQYFTQVSYFLIQGIKLEISMKNILLVFNEKIVLAYKLYAHVYLLWGVSTLWFSMLGKVR